MLIAESAGVNGKGSLVIPSFIRREQHIEAGSRVLKGSYNGTILCVPDGAEIVLIDKLIGNGEIVRGAKKVISTASREYSSPITLFRKTDIGKNGTIYVGSDMGQKRMDIYRVGEQGIMIVSATADEQPNLTVLEGLPGYPDFEWIRQPTQSPDALVESYRSWRNRRGQEIVEAINGDNTLIGLPEIPTEFGNGVVVCVMKDILTSAANQFTL